MPVRIEKVFHSNWHFINMLYWLPYIKAVVFLI